MREWDDSVWSAWSAARTCAYEVLHLAFGAEPEAEHLRRYGSGECARVFSLYGQDGFAGYLQELARRVDDAGEGNGEGGGFGSGGSADPAGGGSGSTNPAAGPADDLPGLRGEALVSAVRSEYTRLFLGPGTLVAPPWSSCYRLPGEGTIFNAVTLAVRGVYKEEGFQAAAYPRVADDHIAIMADFLAKTSHAAAAARGSGDGAECMRLMRMQKRFLEEHVLTWVDTWAEGMRRSKTNLLYPRFAAFAAAAAREDRDSLGEWLA